MESSKQLKLITTDGGEFIVSEKLLERSPIIKGMIDDGTANDDIILPSINKPTFERVVKYLEHVDAGNPAPEIEKPLRSNDLKDVTTEFYANFIELSDDDVQDVILAANYLDLKDLLALGCAKMGSVIRGLTIPEFRKRFNIINDFTPEEEAEPFDEAKLAEQSEEHEKQQAQEKQAKEQK